MYIVALEFTADGPELEHAEIERMIVEKAHASRKKPQNISSLWNWKGES
jgi:hypothetical protein